MFTFHHVLFPVDFSSGQGARRWRRRSEEWWKSGRLTSLCYTRSTRSAGWEGGMSSSASCGG